MSDEITWGATQARRARNYFLESLVLTGFPLQGAGGSSTLNTGVDSLFSAKNWQEPGQPSVQAEIDMLQATNAQGVLATFTADPQNQSNSQGPNDLGGARASTRFMHPQERGVDQLGISLNNGTGAPVTPFQVNVGITSRRLTALDKLLAQRLNLSSQYGAYKLLPIETEALADLNITDDKGNLKKAGLALMQALVKKGSLPFSAEQWRRILFKTVRLHENTFKVTSAADYSQFATYTASLSADDPTLGTWLALDRLAVESGANISIGFDRDNDSLNSGYYSVNGGGFVQSDDAPWTLWLPSTDHISLYQKIGPGGAATTAYVRVRVRELAMTDILAALMGRVTKPSDLPRKEFHKAIVGLVSG